jgi:hypothetical protein
LILHGIKDVGALRQVLSGDKPGHDESMIMQVGINSATHVTVNDIAHLRYGIAPKYSFFCNWRGRNRAQTMEPILDALRIPCLP